MPQFEIRFWELIWVVSLNCVKNYWIKKHATFCKLHVFLCLLQKVAELMYLFYEYVYICNL